MSVIIHTFTFCVIESVMIHTLDVCVIMSIEERFLYEIPQHFINL